MKKLIFVSAIVMLLAPLFGHAELSLSALWNGTLSPALSQIFWQIRVPRVCLAFLVGASLAVCGMVFQTVFRNVLASPFTLGVSSAASLGAALAVKFGLGMAFLGLASTSIAALGAAVMSVGLILVLSRGGVALAGSGLLLAGMCLSLFFSSFVVVLQYIGDFSQLFSITRWLMGSLDTIGFNSVLFLLPWALFGLALVSKLAPQLDLLAVGEEFAAARGVEVRRVTMLLLISTSLIVAVAVSLCGVVGFVGVVVPQMVRSMTGGQHRDLTWATFLGGGVFLVLCDLVSRTVLAPAEIPIGVVTALIGAPLFIVILWRRPTSLAAA